MPTPFVRSAAREELAVAFRHLPLARFPYVIYYVIERDGLSVRDDSGKVTRPQRTHPSHCSVFTEAEYLGKASQCLLPRVIGGARRFRRLGASRG